MERPQRRHRCLTGFCEEQLQNTSFRREKRGNGIGDSSQTHKNPTWGTRKGTRSWANRVGAKHRRLERIWLGGLGAMRSGLALGSPTGPDNHTADKLSPRFFWIVGDYPSGLATPPLSRLFCSPVCLLILACFCPASRIRFASR